MAEEEKGRHLKGVQSLWMPPLDGDLLQIPGENDLSGEWWQTGGGLEYIKVKGGVEEDDEDPHKGGGGSVGVRIFLQIRHSVSYSLLHRHG